MTPEKNKRGHKSKYIFLKSQQMFFGKRFHMHRNYVMIIHRVLRDILNMYIMSC